MRKLFWSAALTSGLIFVGVGGAFAAVSGSITVSTNGAYVSGGQYDFKHSSCQWTTGGWDGWVAGSFVVTTPNDHLNDKVDSYPWQTVVQATRRSHIPSTTASRVERCSFTIRSLFRPAVNTGTATIAVPRRRIVIEL